MTNIRTILCSGIVGVLFFPIPMSWAHNTVTPQIECPSGTSITLNGIVNSTEWQDANYITFVHETQTIQMWVKFDPTINRLLLGFRIPDNTQSFVDDRIIIYFDNYNDGSAQQNYGYGLDRAGAKYEYRSAVLQKHNRPWDALCTDFINSYDMEFSIELDSSHFLFNPGVSADGPGLLVGFQDNGVAYYWPLTGGPATNYNTYTDCHSSDQWLDHRTPTPTPSISPTSTISATPTPSITSTFTITSTMTPSPTCTASPTDVPPGSTVTNTPTQSPSATESPSSTASPTCSATPTGTPTYTVTITTTPTASPSLTPTVTITPLTGVHLSLQKSADKDQATVGEVVRYTLRYTNQGTDIAWHTTITDYLPDHTVYFGGTGNTNIPGKVYWQGVVMPGGSGEVWFDVQVESALPDTPIPNRAYIISDNSNSVTSNTVTFLWKNPVTTTPTAVPPATSTPQIVGYDEAAAYPNPAVGKQVTFIFYSPDSGAGSIRIYNVAYKLVAEISFAAHAGEFDRVRWDVSGIAPGVYVYQVRSGNKTFKLEKVAVVR